MTRVRRERTVASAPRRVWEVVEDPHHLPRWWPGVARVEAVTDDRFTEVHVTKRGRPVRLDFRLVQSDPPSVRRWEQELAGTPFERVLNKAVTEIRLEARPPGTHVTIEQRQQLRGYSRTGGLLLRRATGKRLAQALARLEQIC